MADYNSSYTGAQIDANLAKAATSVQPTNNATVLGSGSATNGQVLSANGSGGTTWATASGGGGTPGGSTTQLQFNDGGAFGGDSGLTFDKTAKTLNVTGATITASDPIIDMAQTWNNAAVAFTAIKANVVDTASAAGSLLMDLQVGGVSRFSVGKAGSITVSGTSGYANSGILFAGAGPKLYANSNIFAVNNTSYGMFGCDFGATQARINGGAAFGFSSGDVTTSLDVILNRDAANTLAQRNGATAQTVNLYGTYTDASNYRRLTKTMSTGGVAVIKPEGLGTGVSGNVLHISGLPTSNPGPGILWNNAGTPAIGT